MKLFCLYNHNLSEDAEINLAMLEKFSLFLIMVLLNCY